MIKIEEVGINGWEAAIRGMRNPLESWDKSDSEICANPASCLKHNQGFCPMSAGFSGEMYCIGENDFHLMKRLANAGADHGKFMRFITVTADITAPRDWWIEYATYKVATVENSCSTMHMIHTRPLEMDDFVTQYLIPESREHLQRTIDLINQMREFFLDATKKGETEWAKTYWRQMIDLLPQSYNQRRTVLLNYQVLKAMYNARKNHKLDEWRDFCAWIETLPYSELITGQSAD